MSVSLLQSTSEYRNAVPTYLQPISENGQRFYGNLSYDESKKSWIIKGEPSVVEMAKRLFPGCDGKVSGQARFYDNKRLNGDLNWLMMRYPLKIDNPEQWQRALNEATEYALIRQKIYETPLKTTPPATFYGKLLPFQEEGLTFMVHNKRCLLADEMGLGKTVEGLALLSAVKGFPALVVCQAHLCLQWEEESKTFLQLPHSPDVITLFQDNEEPKVKVHVIKGLKPYNLPPADIYIIHYLLLRGWKNHLTEYNFKAVILDEIQELRHSGTEKYSAASLLAESVPVAVGLSGTPIYNHGGEIWNVLNILEYHCLGDWDSFTREWCYGYGNDIVVNPELLGDYLKREGLLLRRTKAEVLPELPPKRRVVQTIDFDKGTFGDLIQDTLQQIKLLDNTKTVFERRRLEKEIVDATRRITGIAKAKHVCTFVRMLLEAGEKVLLFAYHHDVFDIYVEELKEFNPYSITGREKSKQKAQSQEAFINGDTNLVLISLRAASGINKLYQATCVVFGELDWSPSIHSQAEDRGHRIGTDGSVRDDSLLCYYLVCKVGTDEDMQDALGLKVSQFVGLMGDAPEGEQDKLMSQVEAGKHMQRIIEKLKSA